MASLYEAGQYQSDQASGHLAALALSARIFLKHPTMVGSAFPASRWMVREMLAPIRWEDMRLFVEYGPGTGAFTREALRRLPHDAILLAIDTSAEFVDHLKQSLPDRRLRAVQASAGDVEAVLADLRLGAADCILSGLPFSSLRPADAAQVMAASAAALRPGGTFCAYQMRTAIEPLLDRHFRTVRARREWRNVPPCRLYWATDEKQS